MWLNSQIQVTEFQKTSTPKNVVQSNAERNTGVKAQIVYDCTIRNTVHAGSNGVARLSRRKKNTILNAFYRKQRNYCSK